VVDRARAELDRERDRSGFRELVAVQTQGQAGVAAGLEVPTGLLAVEGASFEEDVGGLGEVRCVREHVRQCELEVRVGVGELGRHGVRAQPRRDATGGRDRAERGELGLEVEPVARLRLERRRAVAQHPGGVAAHDAFELGLARSTGRADGREDPAARGVQLLVRRAGRTERELLDTVAREARVRVAVDEAGDRAATAPVDLDDVAVQRSEVGHAAHGDDVLVVAEDERMLEDVDRREVGASQRRGPTCRSDELLEVADQESPRRAIRHPLPERPGIGGSSPCSAAASAASG
jgi:hypothetical protein